MWPVVNVVGEAKPERTLRQAKPLPVPCSGLFLIRQYLTHVYGKIEREIYNMTSKILLAIAQAPSIAEFQVLTDMVIGRENNMDKFHSVCTENGTTDSGGAVCVPVSCTCNTVSCCPGGF